MARANERSAFPSAGKTRKGTYTIDVALFSPRGRALSLLLVKRAQEPNRYGLPFEIASADEGLESAARRLVRQHVGVEAAWIEQLGAFADGKDHPAGVSLSIAFVGVLPGAPPAHSADWVALREVSALAARQREIADAALGTLRTSLDDAPIAFRLLSRLFTLSELQSMYELLLGRRLHKASFRRALLAASVVEATDDWQSKGRGRPAQFFRYTPRGRKANRRPIRFDMLG
jgi:8-oxo-dGTP diphosphatase